MQTYKNRITQKTSGSARLNEKVQSKIDSTTMFYTQKEYLKVFRKSHLKSEANLQKC